MGQITIATLTSNCDCETREAARQACARAVRHAAQEDVFHWDWIISQIEGMMPQCQPLMREYYQKQIDGYLEEMLSRGSR